MRAGLTISAAGHVTFLALGIAFLPALQRPIANPIEPIPIDFVFSDETNVPRGSQPVSLDQELPPAPPVRDAPPLPGSVTIRPEPGATGAIPPPSGQPIAPAPRPPPEPAVAASAAPVPRLRPVAPLLSAEREAFDVDRITAMLDEPPPSPQTPTPQGGSFDIDAVTAMLDAPGTQPAGERAAAALDVDRLTAMLDGAPPDQSPATAGKSAALGSLLVAATGPMTVNEIDALRARLAGCWSPPLGWHDPAEVRVVVRLNLTADGSLAAAPEVLESPAGRYQVAAPDSVIRAVRRCAPYNLPPEKYDSWQQMRITFDPVDMGAT